MKKFAKLMLVALMVAVIASAFAFSALADEATVVDPRTLVPGSDRVIFIKDAPRDENNQYTGEPLEGDGTGTDAANPLKPADDHERFDPTAERKRWHLLTALYQANEMLAETGGTIVICGPVFIGINELGDNGASSVRDNETVVFGNKVIKYTSVYNGVDYRETAGAKLILQTPAMLLIRGSTIWENIDIATDGTDRAICFSDYPTLVGQGVKCYPTDDAFEGVASNYVGLSAGHRFNGGKNKTPTLVVQSGTYNKITASSWGTVATNTLENYTTNLTLEGTTTVLGVISGTVQAKTPFSGHVNITINSGTYECDINAVGPTGMLNTDGVAKITINGGDFKNAWSINKSAMGASNNLPASCSIDFSGWTGDKLGLAYANSIITDITDIKYPDGVTADELHKLIENAPVDTEAEETEAEVEETKAEVEETKAEVEETKAEVEETKAEVEETKAETPDTTDENGGGSNVIVIVAICVAVIVVAVAVIVIATKKKK